MRTAEEIRKTVPVWVELRRESWNDADEGLNVMRRDDKGEADYWLYLGFDGEWEEQQKFAREVAETFGLPLVETVWNEENEDVSTVVYDPPDRLAELRKAGDALYDAAKDVAIGNARYEEEPATPTCRCCWCRTNAALAAWRKASKP